MYSRLSYGFFLHLSFRFLTLSLAGALPSALCWSQRRHQSEALPRFGQQFAVQETAEDSPQAPLSLCHEQLHYEFTAFFYCTVHARGQRHTIMKTKKSSERRPR